MTLCANSQTDGGSFGVNAAWPSKYALAVEQTATYGGYSSPPTFQRLHAGSNSNATVRAVNADIISAINAGRGQILYRGHGNEFGWVWGWDGSGTGSGADFTGAGHVASLANAVQPIVYGINCLNSRINRSDCIAEQWMSLPNAGAVAHFGASVTSYTTENHERTKGIFRAIYESGFTRIGPMLAEAERISYGTSGGGDSWDNNTFAYMLLGDPEMQIRRNAVFRLAGQAGLIARLIPNLEGLVIAVEDAEGKRLPEAFVQVTDESGRRFNGFANSEGEVPAPGIDPEFVARLDLIFDGFPFTVQYMKPPKIEAIGFVASGFKVRLPDVPQGNFRIFGSFDLQNWQNLGLATPVGTDQEFIDSAAAIGGERYYRAVQEQ